MRAPLARLALALASSSACFAAPPPSVVTLGIDVPSFLARADPVWSFSGAPAPMEWVDAFFGGSGDSGFLMWFPSPNALRIEVGRTTLYDDRTPDLGTPLYLNNFALDQPRLPIGYVEVTWSGAPITAAAGRLDLLRARATVNVTTAAGAFSVSAWAPAAAALADAIVVEVAPLAGADTPRTAFVPLPAVSTWASQDARYVFNPAAVAARGPAAGGGTLNTTLQPHLPAKGSAHATAVLERAGAAPGATTLFVATSSVRATPAAALAAATAAVTAAADAGNTLRAAHEAWWADWWVAGALVTFDDTALESFWCIQMFKFGSAVRAGGPVHDLMGPWFIDGTDWPDLHWDLNLQYTYYSPLAANRPALSQTLADFIAAVSASGALAGNVPSEWAFDSSAAPTGASSLSANETCYWDYAPGCKSGPPSVTGNLLWTLSLIHAHAVFSANASVDADIVFPILTRALAFYAHFTTTAADGSLHLNATFSPEYPGPPGADANYDVALYRWGLALGIALAADLHIDNPTVEGWKTTLAHFTWFSVDWNATTPTLEIYAGRPYAKPHRHFSHLMSIWPLALLDLDNNATQAALARASVNMWLSTPEEGEGAGAKAGAHAHSPRPTRFILTPPAPTQTQCSTAPPRRR